MKKQLTNFASLDIFINVALLVIAGIVLYQSATLDVFASDYIKNKFFNASVYTNINILAGGTMLHSIFGIIKNVLTLIVLDEKELKEISKEEINEEENNKN